MAILPYVIVVLKMLLFSRLSSAIDTISKSQPLQDDGRTTLVSKDGTFELGFFSPGSSKNRYIGIWYKNIQPRAVVWVANREIPVKDNSGMLTINTEGHLGLLDRNETIIWVANSSTKALTPIVQLLGSGNLILRDEKDQNPQNYLWQSFDYPSDTILPGMKLGWDLRTGLNRRIIAWKNWDDPSPGDFTGQLMVHDFPEVVVWKGRTKYLRSGPWDGQQFSGTSLATDGSPFVSVLVSNKYEVYYTFNTKIESFLARSVFNQSTYTVELIWKKDDQRWKNWSISPKDNCDTYNLCGPNGNCVIGGAPICQCLRGFTPKSPNNWDALDWSEGCVRSESWSCKVKNKDGFLKMTGLKLPETTHTWVDASMTLEECKAKCIENCSCTAYSNSDTVSSRGCAIWFGALIDIREVSLNADLDLYIRLAASETAEVRDGGRNNTKVIVVLATIVFAFVIVIIFLCIYKTRRKYREGNDVEESKRDMEIPFYNYVVIVTATNNFSIDKKLGQGGFGPVYKGTLADGQEIAVKRLSKTSHQGMKEFKNEVILCFKLQHQNLVKVLGCCIKGEEKMLIYEYMSNKSLDSWIFGSITQRNTLDWSKRFQIICGIVRGLLYLHQDSRLKIIHRDLKASNVLLDNEMNPKISDFGLARIFGGGQIEENTNKVVGTYGYMAPEYAYNGIFSIKSDVFSFGILLLETVSGMKSRGLSYPNQCLNLIGHVWRLWKESMPLKLIDACLEDSFIVSEALRCIHISLLCVQHHPDDRPNMASVVMMLSNESDLPQPKEPAFLLERSPGRQESAQNNHISSSINEMSFTELDAR
ncbi:hypothetical protein QN277_008668 [Acacia crassicarpa]|uniref:Receptor-like serine/threonine-protein kinase n=1 Tax=Acacia crassicarpa TaxID=499986 RepID=A0AAE1ITG8_9FABA|nr:hypothetical protein QN277_008668 [Acacia crassicarpa]